MHAVAVVRDTEQALGPREEETLKVCGELGKCMADCGAHSLARQLVQDLLPMSCGSLRSASPAAVLGAQLSTVPAGQARASTAVRPRAASGPALRAGEGLA